MSAHAINVEFMPLQKKARLSLHAPPPPPPPAHTLFTTRWLSRLRWDDSELGFRCGVGVVSLRWWCWWCALCDPQLAADHADGFIDIWTPLMKINGLNATLGGNLSGESLTCDGCHPKDAGLTIMAATIMKAIKAAGL
eukprot:COSAG05_NODE_3765_length_1850_cov_1.398629_2_plen_138_part_00